MGARAKQVVLEVLSGFMLPCWEAIAEADEVREEGDEVEAGAEDD